MTRTGTPTTLLGTLSAVNEAVIGHDDDEHWVNGALLDVAEAVEAFTDHVNADSDRVVGTLQAVGGDELVMNSLRTVLLAGAAARKYRGSLRSSGIGKVADDVRLVRAAATMVSAFSEHLEELA